MSAAGVEPKQAHRSTFRARLHIAMMLVIGAITLLGLFLAERKVAMEAEYDVQQDFRNELATLHGVQETRNVALAERCGQLVARPRIHAALEDNALDLLYPSAQDELRDILQPGGDPAPGTLRATFYRFVDSTGTVIPPPADAEVGALHPEEEAQLAMRGVPGQPQTGYLARRAVDGETIDELIAMPIVSTQTGEIIAALVLGLKPIEFGHSRAANDIKSGIWLNGVLHLPALQRADRTALAGEIARALPGANDTDRSFRVRVGSTPHLLFFKELNPGSSFPTAYEVALYPQTDAIARQHQLRGHVMIAGSVLLLIGLVASHLLSARLSVPVEKLAVASEHERAGRARAEAALESTSVELQRSARFSADASHQLKTPVTVLRAGIEELLGREDLPPHVYGELSALLHQTYRITNVVDDLLLLSQMDAGRLQIQFGTVNLSQLIEEWVDDLSALPDELNVQLDTNFSPNLYVAGEKRYITLIVQNLLENARKYNVPNGRICVAAEERGEFVVLTVENTARPIPAAAREHIFERFHRGTVGENVSGHGLGLNLARELAWLHGGDLRLVRSDEEMTEFELRLRTVRRPAPARQPVAPTARVA